MALRRSDKARRSRKRQTKEYPQRPYLYTADNRHCTNKNISRAKIISMISRF
ncbi:hypothetical protein ETAE_3047 [Edwardsiella piscicida]|uniref:Uncharacterized protein n=1 Tax=Edwardsiella piscicida TaxID=1263550 RepID=A0AAU8P5J3_EDWPI|nr:hypothetical protein ETAE_3047 [Edwardsiella tarda EIB202]